MRKDNLQGRVTEKIKNFVNQAGLDMPTSQLEVWIGQACDPMHLKSPNLSLNMEIVDLINKKKKTWY
jgi:hypothetical protein